MNRNRHFNGYIWQQAGWPEFVWDNAAIVDQLGRVSYLHGLLEGRMSMLGFYEKSESILSSLSDELINSSSIEGVVLNLQSVRSSIARRLGLDTDGMLVEDHYVEGLVDVMLDAINNCDAPLADERIFGWHAALFPTGRSGMHRITVGDWRRGEEPMQVVSGAFGHEKVHYEAPASDAVAAEMAKLVEWVNTCTMSPFIMSAIAHLWFVTIHPFDDGNGRLSRTLADMILSRGARTKARYFSMSAEINRNKKGYYDVLERTQKGGLDITEWLTWFLTCLENALNHALDTISNTLRKSEFWNRFAETAVNERQRKVLNRLWDGIEGKLTTSKWAKMCKCSQDTALRDINDLISKGMLRPSGESGRSTAYLLAEE